MFKGNSDGNTTVYHNLTKALLVASEIHFLPHLWESRIAMRVEIYGCPGNICIFFSSFK